MYIQCLDQRLFNLAQIALFCIFFVKNDFTNFPPFLRILENFHATKLSSFFQYIYLQIHLKMEFEEMNVKSLNKLTTILEDIPLPLLWKFFRGW